jgi:hypothetical protein
MVALVKKSYRYSMVRMVTFWAMIAALFIARPVFSATEPTVTKEAYAAVFNSEGMSAEEIRKSGTLAGSTCYDYGQGYYYGQAAYYSQGAYEITFSNAATISGTLGVSGRSDKGSGTFVIDHPLDPKNKLLFHSFVESPDAKNIYDGVVTLDQNGEAVIRLPDYFMALNENFVYQLKPMGTPQPNLYVKHGVVANAFTIAGGEANGRVSWQLTGNRHDAYILSDPIIPEVNKSTSTRVAPGSLLHPDVYPPRFGSFSRAWSFLKGLVE